MQSQGRKTDPCDAWEPWGRNQDSGKGGNVIYMGGGKSNPMAGNRAYVIGWQLGKTIKFQKFRKNFAE